MTTVIRETHRTHQIRYIRLYDNHWVDIFMTITGSISLMVLYVTSGWQHPHSSQCFNTDMFYLINLCLKLTVSLNNVIY